MATTSLKVTHNGLTRKLLLREPLQWAELERQVQTRFNVQPGQDTFLTYTDSDGDIIAVVDLDELHSTDSIRFNLITAPTCFLPLNQTSPHTGAPQTHTTAPGTEISRAEASGEASESLALPRDAAHELSPFDDAHVANFGELEPISSEEDLVGPGGVWSTVEKDELDSGAQTPTAVDVPLADVNAQPEPTAPSSEPAEVDAHAFDDPMEEEVVADAASVASTATLEADDPDDETGAPPAEAEAEADTSADAFPMPQSISNFLSALPLRADSIASHFTSLLSEPSTAPLRSLLTTPPRSVDDIPVIARTFAGELSSLLGTALSGVREEAESVRREFEQMKADLAKEKNDLTDRLAKEWQDALAQEQERRDGQREKDVEQDEDEREEAAERAEEAGVAAEALPMDPESRAARKAARHAARLARKEARRQVKLSELSEKAQRKAERASRRSSRASSVIFTGDDAETVAELDTVAEAEAEAGRAEDAASVRSVDTRSTLTRVSTPPSIIGEYPSLAAFNAATSTAPASSGPLFNPSDDFFLRRTSGPPPPPRPFGVPGAFPSAPVTNDAPSRPVFVGNSSQSRSNTLPAPAASSFFAPPPDSMPGAFSAPGTDSAPPSSLFSGFVNRQPPVPLNQRRYQSGWGEVTPDQVKEAVGKLGFDLKSLGVRIAADRAWEENRGKPLAEIVTACVDKLL